MLTEDLELDGVSACAGEGGLPTAWAEAVIDTLSGTHPDSDWLICMQWILANGIRSIRATLEDTSKCDRTLFYIDYLLQL